MRDFHSEPNLGALQASLLFEALYRGGVRRILLAPGSRSTPLVRAAVTHGGFDRTVRVDERAMGFHALGIGRASGIPAAVITTSGTAVANLLPAAVEAAYDGVPILFITADRPPELLGVGANQAIAQPNLLAPTVEHVFELDAPGEPFDPRAVVDLAAHALARATESGGAPVHINCAFREPLAPTEAPWDRACLAAIASWLDEPSPHPAVRTEEHPAAQPWVAAFMEAKRPLLLLGADRPATRPGDPDAHARLVEVATQRAGAVVQADLRSAFGMARSTAGVVHLADRWLELLPVHEAPDFILQVGGRLISKRLLTYLEDAHAIPLVLADPHVEGPLPGHDHAELVQLDAQAVATLLENAAPETRAEAGTAWQQRAQDLDASLARALTSALDEGRTLSEAAVARRITRQIDPSHALFTSNSLPVRLLSDYGHRPEGVAARLGANRGASGIDGIVSSAIGFAEGAARPTTLLIGDLALLHDIGSLGCLKYADQPLTIVLLNNGGGGIFSFLPVAEHKDLFTPWFDTPHGLTFASAANQFGLRYFEVDSLAAFDDAYTTATRFKDPALIEVRTTMADTRTMAQDLEALLQATAREALGRGASEA